MLTVIVAEKPSVARDIARVLGVRGKRDGYLEGNGYRITWALGHLVHFAEPNDYGKDWAGRWSMGQLPMIPERWRLRGEKKTANQYRAVKALLTAKDTERVVCATDAGREGELIFRLIAEHARCRKPVERLWVSSLTDDAIRGGLARLRPAKDYDELAAAARARAQADWLVGMNLTRAYTVHNRLLCTIGRVQTPTLAMIVARDAAIDNFTKAYFYVLVAHLSEGFDARYTRDGDTRIDDKREAERLHRRLAPHKTGTVTKIDVKVRRNRPPPLYDLTTLQRDANRRYGYTAAKVLELAQALYETHKLISYPRTESRHIGEDMLPELPGILAKVDHPLAAEALERLQAGHKLGRAYVDKTRLTDHHAILPTARRPPESLPEPLRRIYDLVAARFVAVFLPDQQVEETRVLLDIGGETFVAKGARVLEPGWKRVEPPRRKPAAAADTTKTADGSEQGSLPELEQGQTVHVDSLEVQEKETQPPRPFEDATLLNAMRHAGREIEDDALAAAMKDSGLGTPATRAEIIEKLIRTGYVERQRKQLRATDKGKALIGLVAEPLRSAELTAAWEQRLKDVEHGRADAGAFYADICRFVTELIPQVAVGPALSAEQVAAAKAAEPQRGRGRSSKGRRSAQGKASTGGAEATELGTCPVCKQGRITENSRAFGCERFRDGCGFTIWKTIAGHRLTDSEVRSLIADGRTGRIDGLRSKAGRSFAAVLRLDDSGKVGFDFDAGSRGQTSPACAEVGTPAAEDQRRAAAQREDINGTDGSAAASRPPQRFAASLAADPLTCPKCGQGRIIEGRRGFGCSRWRDGCDFVVSKEIAGHQLTEAELRALIRDRRTAPIPGFQGGAGTAITHCIVLDGALRAEIEPQG